MLAFHVVKLQLCLKFNSLSFLKEKLCVCACVRVCVIPGRQHRQDDKSSFLQLKSLGVSGLSVLSVKDGRTPKTTALCSVLLHHSAGFLRKAVTQQLWEHLSKYVMYTHEV